MLVMDFQYKVVSSLPPSTFLAIALHCILNPDCCDLKPMGVHVM